VHGRGIHPAPEEFEVNVSSYMEFGENLLIWGVIFTFFGYIIYDTPGAVAGLIIGALVAVINTLMITCSQGYPEKDEGADEE
jgi:hypothetical protein